VCAESVSGLGSFGALCGVEVVSRSACAVWSVVSRTGVWSCTGSVGKGWGRQARSCGWPCYCWFGGRVPSCCNFRIVLNIGLDVSV
jgi:hypothetical protein